MDTRGLTTADAELVDRAAAAIESNYHPDRHRTGAALRTADGETYVGVHLDAVIATTAVHAEAVALGAALTDGAGAIEAVAAVAHGAPDIGQQPRVIPPCGACRELLASYAPDAAVVVEGDDGLTTRSVTALLPDAWYHERTEK